MGIILYVPFPHDPQRLIGGERYMASELRPHLSILYVEDSDAEAMLVSLAEAEADLGWEIVRARNGREGLEMARAVRFDGILTDYEMPVMNGLELLRELKNGGLLRTTAVILSSNMTEEIASCANKLGAAMCVMKSFDIRDICVDLCAIDKIIRRGCDNCRVESNNAFVN